MLGRRGAAAARLSHKRQVAEDGALAEECDKSEIGDTAKGDQQRQFGKLGKTVEPGEP